MATILSFQTRTPSRASSFGAAHGTAQIFLFTGVRYERTDDDEPNAKMHNPHETAVRDHLALDD